MGAGRASIIVLGSERMKEKVDDGVVMIEWFAAQYWVTGVVTFFLMWSDWLLTILQERERHLHYAEHYQSYPVNTIEGNPLYQLTVKAKRIAEPKHLIPALILSVLVAYALVWIPQVISRGFHRLCMGSLLDRGYDPCWQSPRIPGRAARPAWQALHASAYRLSYSNRTLFSARRFSHPACGVFRLLLYCGSRLCRSDVRRSTVTLAARIPAIDVADEPPSAL